MSPKKLIELSLVKACFKYAIYFCFLFFYGCGDNSDLEEISKLKETEKQLRSDIGACKNRNSTLETQLNNINDINESCKKELGEIKIKLAKLETQLSQANEIISTTKENLRLSYEAEFSGDLRNKFIQEKNEFVVQLEQEKKDFMTKLEKEKNEFEKSSIKTFVMVLIFMIAVCFVFYIWIKNYYLRKEDNLKSKIERKEHELNAKLAAIEDEKTAMLNEIYTRNIYGQKLNETINMLKSELNKPTNSNSGEPK
jgi:cell division protein FtsB